MASFSSQRRPPTTWVAAAAPEGFNAAEDDELGVVERRMLQRGKREHRETTERARRALQIAEETVDIGSNTLVEVHRQGLQLERADHGIENMEKDVIEASRILKFMRRWCCFQVICCCDCFDADVDLTNTRKQRVKLRQQQRVVHDEHLQTRALGHQMSLQRENTLKDDIELNVNSTSMARAELLANRNNVNRDNISHIDANDGIGFGLPDQDREEIQQETRRQDAYLDRIGQAVENMKAISLEMQDELNRQDPEIDIISERIHQTHSNLGNLYRDARKI